MSAERVTSPTKTYLWAIGPGTEAVPVGQHIRDRYEVIAPHIWLDLTPDAPPQPPASLPEAALPYLNAHSHRLHVPGVYDVVPQPDGTPWLLLENAPINTRSTQLYPTLSASWATAASIRQMSWLWQLWQLWEPLLALGVAASLRDLDNIRVEGWRIRVLQFIVDSVPPSLEDVILAWYPLLEQASSAIAPALKAMGKAVLAGDLSAEAVAVDLNHCLRQEMAQARYQFRIAGATHSGPNHARNEDACYPEGELPDIPAPRIAIVCDGVGGHEAGEVASHATVRALQLQLQGLLTEAGQEASALAPEVIKQQIGAAIRVVNDLVSAQNDRQSRSDRQRMGTTLVMALVVPQRLQTADGWRLIDELYIAHVGDSRAYWITPDYCHQLTVDDDIAGRDTAAGRSFYTALRDRQEAGALTQAIGTRDSTFLTPHIQRFVLDDAGVLLLCSDGLSDNHRIEAAWANYIGLITKDIISLQSAVDSWIELANQKNGHDNVSVVLLRATPFVKTAEDVVADDEATADNGAATNDLTDASKALLYGEQQDTMGPPPAPTPAAEAERPRIGPGWVTGIAIAILLVAGVVGWWVAGTLAPSTPETTPESVQ